MPFQDISLECIDCHQAFTFTAGEQEFFERKGLQSPPRRCKACREDRRQRRDGGAGGSSPRGGSAEGDGGRGSARPAREMFDAVCAACGSPTRVPFKPTTSRPVYCRECFANRARG